MANVNFENLIDIDDLAAYDGARAAKNDQAYETKADAAAKANVVEGAKIGDAAATVDAQKNILLGTAAGASTTDFDQSGAADAVLGSPTDADTAATVHGARAKAASAASAAQAAAIAAVTGDAETDTAATLTLNGLKKKVEALSGEGGSVAEQISSAIGGLDSSIPAEEGKAIAAFEIEDGKIKAGSTRKVELGTAASRAAEATLTDGANLPTGAAVKSFVEGKGYQTADEVGAIVSQAAATAMDWKGVKATKAELPASGNKSGDVWHVTADGSEYAWDGSAWEELGVTFDASGFARAADFSIASQADVLAIVNGSGE